MNSENSFLRRARALLILLLSSVISSGCSNSASTPKWEVQRGRSYDVSVYSDGKEVKDFNKELIHRVELPARVVASLSQQGSRLPIDGRTERDGRGNVTGIRVITSKQGASPAVLGLRDKDLITAIGARRVRQTEDLRTLFTSLAKDKSTTLTLEREGRPHKILYYLSQGANATPAAAGGAGAS